MAPRPKEPLKLLPLEQFKKFVAAIARVPKEAVDKKTAEAPKTPPSASRNDSNG